MARDETASTAAPSTISRPPLLVDLSDECQVNVLEDMDSAAVAEAYTSHPSITFSRPQA
ncbi:hypothetical protein DPMN_085296 [Dreissena polymorpha]|uniref:Uncharacterized protein n=1 Tax=Dreissena polymorpha TaxID=45954 RepID=A0A9D3YES0_DREPO|nr:hypothetical protein DPMN_085296 [Dreissena polymorpha]